MAHGVLTGIGFPCAGVIFRTGFSIHGLTTAASLRITSAIGILFGVGLCGLGIVATVVTGLILVALRLISLRLPAQTIVDPTPRADRIEVAEDGTLAVRSWRIHLRGTADLKALAATLSGLPGVRRVQLDPRDD